MLLPSARTKKRLRRRALVRNADDSRLYNLMLDVNTLRSELQRLELDRGVFATRALVSRQSRLGALLSASARVFRVFRNGYQPSRWRPSQHAFVRAAFDERVSVSEHSAGRERLLEQWRLYSELFQLGVFGVSSLRVLVCDTDECYSIVEALGEFDGRVTPAALAVVFPHVAGNRALELALFGRPFRCPTRTLLHFDRRGRITRFDANADMVTAMSQLVGSSPELVAALMTHARINESSMIETVGEDQGGSGGFGEEDEEEGETQEGDREQELLETGANEASHGNADTTSNHTRDRQSVAFILS